MFRPELVAMTVWHDETVPNALEVFEQAKTLNVDGWGCKDVGIPKTELATLIAAMKKTGKRVTLEILMETEDEIMESAKFAIDCGIDAAVGGAFSSKVCELLKKNNVEYYPFIGKAEGIPHRLGGTVEELAEESEWACQEGATGVCLPFYRYKGDPTELIKCATERIKNPIISAGSVDSREKFLEMAKYGVRYLNIGSSFFTSDFVENGTFSENVKQAIEWLDEMKS